MKSLRALAALLTYPTAELVAAVAEIRDVLAGIDIELVAQSDLGIAEADETGTTFVENALLKAKQAARISGLSAAGEVLVSDTVRSLARTSAGVSFEDRGEQELKGVGEAVRVWRLVARRSGRLADPMPEPPPRLVAVGVSGAGRPQSNTE